MRPSKLRFRRHTARSLLDGNDDASDTAESQLHAQQMLFMVLIMCFRGTSGQRNQIVLESRCIRSHMATMMW